MDALHAAPNDTSHPLGLPEHYSLYAVTLLLDPRIPLLGHSVCISLEEAL